VTSGAAQLSLPFYPFSFLNTASASRRLSTFPIAAFGTRLARGPSSLGAAVPARGAPGGLSQPVTRDPEAPARERHRGGMVAVATETVDPHQGDTAAKRRVVVL
jgi:hypothetical protein